jgi:hypothetical protein
VPPPGADVVRLGTLELVTAIAFDLGLFVLVAGSLAVLIHELTRLVQEGPR